MAGQKELKDALTSLSQSSIGCFAEASACLASPEDIQVSAGEALSLFAQKMGIKLLANQGNVQIEAQHDGMNLAAQRDITIESTENSLKIYAKNGIMIPCGESYIKIDSTGTELGTTPNVGLKCGELEVSLSETSADNGATLGDGELEVLPKKHFSSKPTDFSD